jgi:DNA-binding NtrC family response regulator
MQQLRAWIERVAQSAAPVLLQGASGTGKELVAQALGSLGARRGQPFVALNCGALSAELAQSELFGHERGAFTGAAGARAGAFLTAQGGTLFLDEIGDLPLNLQVQLLRVLESGEVRRLGATHSQRVQVRIIAATHRDLAQEVRRGRFREDLFFRLHVLVGHVPSLNQRREDIDELATHFLKQDAIPERAATLTPAALLKLQAHDWPGNVRELRHVLWRARIYAAGREVDANHIEFAAPLSRQKKAMAAVRPLRIYQHRAIMLALKRHRGNRTHAAASLGLSRATLHRRLLELGITKA